MATYTFDKLKEKYGSFQHPTVAVEVNDKEIGNSKKGFPISDIVVDLTSGFEASTAEFSIYDVYDSTTATFQFEKVKKYILLGSKVEIYLGYYEQVKSVFVGTITRVNFLFEKGEIPCIRVTAMDIKGIMMSGSYSKQLTATSFSDAVSEVLNKTAYEKLKSVDIVRSVHVSDTPDKLRNMGQGAGTVTDKSIEMVAESDYEFVVKAAKKNNFEFFTECGHVYFRKAKSDTSILMEIGPNTGMHSFDVSYDVTGLVEKVTVRGMNVAKAQVISADKKFSNKISQGNKVKPLLKGSQKVYIDSTVSSKEEAEDRAASLMENMSYRYGSLECELLGIPELLPGHFVKLSGLGTGADNCFYLTRVRHVLSQNGRYDTKLEGSAAGVGGSNALPGIGGAGMLSEGAGMLSEGADMLGGLGGF